MYDGANWTWLSPATPSSMAVSGTNLYAGFGALGLWKCDGASWTEVHTIGPDKMVIPGASLYLNYSAMGLWKWDGVSAWTALTPANAEVLVIGN